MRGAPRAKRTRSLGALLALIAALVGARAAAAGEAQRYDGPPLFVYRVFVSGPADVASLLAAGFDVLEARGADHLLVQGEADLVGKLAGLGLRAEVDHEVDTSRAEKLFLPDTVFGGYRTVAEHEAHLDAVAAAHPDLALVVDYGDSWRKVNARPGPHDLKAICLTKRRAGDCQLSPVTDKPRFVLIGAIHARELTTSELAWRFIDHLANGYGADADLTALLDHSEVWVVPVVNPDGRAIVEQGGAAPYTQRKNANDTNGTGCASPPTASSQWGVDLNRNASFAYHTAGFSTAPCSLTYDGLAAASEPEQSFVESFLSSLFPDQRGPNPTDAAPVTATGAMVTLHSYSNLVLLPWGWTECSGAPCPPAKQAPNDAALRSFAFRMSAYNSYQTAQASEVLYAAGGATDDWTYGVLGVPAFTFEVGPTSGACSGFSPSYSCQDGTFWPLNRDAFVYAAKNARQPYVSTLGPTAKNVVVTPSSVAQGTPVALTATLDDAAYGAFGVGRPASQNVTAAEFYVDTPPWLGGTAVPMNPQDGSWSAPVEAATASVSTALAPGRHTLFVRGRDAAGNWGAVTAQWFTVTGGGPTGAKLYTLSPCRALDTRDPAGPYGGPPLAAAVPRSFALAGRCGVPADAVAAAVNVTVVNATNAGDLRIFPTGIAAPGSSVINFGAGQVRANNAILALTGTPAGSVTVQPDLAAGTVDLVLDVSGYFK